MGCYRAREQDPTEDLRGAKWLRKGPNNMSSTACRPALGLAASQMTGMWGGLARQSCPLLTTEMAQQEPQQPSPKRASLGEDAGSLEEDWLWLQGSDLPLETSTWLGGDSQETLGEGC